MYNIQVLIFEDGEVAESTERSSYGLMTQAVAEYAHRHALLGKSPVIEVTYKDFAPVHFYIPYPGFDLWKDCWEEDLYYRDVMYQAQEHVGIAYGFPLDDIDLETFYRPTARYWAIGWNWRDREWDISSARLWRNHTAFDVAVFEGFVTYPVYATLSWDATMVGLSLSVVAPRVRIAPPMLPTPT